jgi:hypothetical protein
MNFDLAEEDQAIRDEHVLTLVDYVKAAIELLLKNDSVLESSRMQQSKSERFIVEHPSPPSIKRGESVQHQTSDSIVSMVSCPSHYEVIIQNYESDIRKHIRVQQQLKLHIEQMEDACDNLEAGHDRMQVENESLKE